MRDGEHMRELHDWSLSELVAALATGQISSQEATDACLRRAEATAGLGAYLHLAPALATAQAQASDARRRAGRPLGPLDGVPIALKDTFMTADMPSTCGSRLLAGYVPPYDATVVTRLRAAGAVLLGKLNMDEFAMGSSNEHSGFGPVRNPWDSTRVPGGSSGGSAVAVAAGSAFAALGTDTGGSIRQPAALCGIVGLKPTYGRVSRQGVVAYASSLDQPGPMGKSVRDCAQVLQAIAGADAADATASNRALPDYCAELEAGVAGLRLGVPREYFADGIDPEVRTAVEAALATYERLGAKLVEVSLPYTKHGIATYYIVAPAEASSNLARFDGVRYGTRVAAPEDGLMAMYTKTRAAGLGAEVKRRIMLGTYALSAGHYDAVYVQAQKVRTRVRDDFAAAFATVDALVTPTTPAPAFALGARADNPMQMYLGDAYTVTANLAGLPGLSLPCGFSAAGLPIGLQILAPWWGEALALRIGRAYERACAWESRRAPCL